MKQVYFITNRWIKIIISKTKYYTLIIILIFINKLTIAENYFISPNGDDDNVGTIDMPFASIQKGHDMALPGDTIYIRGGKYFPTAQTVFSKEGKSDSYFVLMSYPGEVPIIDGKNIPEGNIERTSTPTWQFDGAKYWRIIGPITLTNGRGAGIWIDGKQFLEFVQIESCYNGKRTSRAGHGFMVWKGSDIEFINCDAHHNANHLWKSGEDQLANQYQHGDGWRIFSGTNIRLVGCRSWHNLDDDYDFYSADMPIELVDCWAAYAGRDDSLGSITGIPSKDMPRIDGSNLLWGNGIKLGYNKDAVKHRVVRCVSWGNNAAGFHMNLGPSSLLNSVSYKNKVFGFDFTDGNKHTIFNSWEFNNNYDNPNYPEEHPDNSLSSHNSWDGSINIFISDEDFVNLDNTGMFGSRLEDGKLPITSFLRLAAGSDLIDNGTDVGLAFVGNAPDIGAFEYGDTAVVFTNYDVSIPLKFDLSNYPNPFNPSTNIWYNLPKAGYIDLTIFDIMGREVIRLEQGYRSAGSHQLSWNARNKHGRKISGGVYIMILNSKNYQITRKMLFIK